MTKSTNPCAAACVFVRATLLKVLSCVAFGTGFRTGPICIFAAYLGAASFTGQIKLRKPSSPSLSLLNTVCCLLS